MLPFSLSSSLLRDGSADYHLMRRTSLAIGKPVRPAPLTLEAWAQGFMVDSLIIMAFITISNMRRGVLLHKLILIELLLASGLRVVSWSDGNAA